MKFKSNEAKTWLEDENGKQVAVLDHPEVRPGVVNLVHTEVDPSVADSLREKGLKAELSCSYSIKWFAKHPEYADVLADPDKEKQKAEMLAGPACGLRRG